MVWFLLFMMLFQSSHCINTCKKLDQYCYCDEECLRYGDCCPGHSNYNKPAVFANISTCKLVTQSLSIQMIERCSYDNHKFADLCTKSKLIPDNYLKSLIPVVTASGELYNNLFCALCNYQTQFQFLNITINCVDIQPKSVRDINLWLQNSSECSVTALFPENRIRHCFNKLIRHCPIEFVDKVSGIIDKCEHAIAYNDTIVFTDGEIYYRNKHCCKCWNNTCFALGVSGGITVSGFSYMLNFNEWEKDNIIVNNSNNGTFTPSEYQPFYYVCIVLTVLSIVFLVVLICIYVSQKVFHTFGGYVTICLSVCIVLLNILTLMTSNNNSNLSFPLLCKYLAVLKHFMSLCAFIWMSIYALDLMQTFGFRSTFRNQRKTFKIFICYCAMGFGLGAAIVTTATALDIVSSNSTLRPHYGGNNCWFTSTLGGLVWYFVPVCLLLVVNVVACVVVFYQLSQTANDCRLVQRNESNNTLWLCIRLTVVFGIGYLFQIMAVLTTINWLIVIGSLVNCLQGALLAACFLWTQLVRTAVKTSITVIGSNNSNPQHQTTMVTLTTNDKNGINQS